MKTFSFEGPVAWAFLFLATYGAIDIIYKLYKLFSQ